MTARPGGDLRALAEAAARLHWYLLTNGDTKQWSTPWFPEMVRDLRVVMDGYDIATETPAVGADAEAGAPEVMP